MPNTLAHLGSQAPALRAVLPHADVRWILLSYLIPDVPWIVQRALGMVPWVAQDPYALRLYVMMQASLFLCLLLAGALAAVSRRPREVFVILAAGIVLHLLLDAAETKWGNGVHLWAPFSWELSNFGWFWPESSITLVLSLGGLVYLGWEAARRLPARPQPALRLKPWWRPILALGLFVAYLSAPLAFREAALASDSHSIRTLREVDRREGRRVAFDQVEYRPRPGGGVVTSFAGETLRVRGNVPASPSLISLRGRFVDEETVRARRVFVHRRGFRDAASVLGLVLLALVWLRGRRRGPNVPSERADS